jgi:uncharacterized protein YlxW (UPF0749 family)
MFRFSIRELMLVTMVVGMLFACMTERCRMEAAIQTAKESDEQAKSAGDEAKKWQQSHRRLAGERNQLEDQLASHKIEIWWSPSGNATLCTRDKNGDAVSLQISSNSP